MTNYSYDNLGRTTAVEDPNSHTTSYGYNSANEVTSVTDALGKVTGLTYDATGHVLTVTAPNPSGSGSGPVTTYTYSDVGQLLTTTDPLGNVTTDAYDHDGRLITVTAPVPATGVSAPVTSYTYDSLSRLSTETDPLGNITTLGYDAAGELTSVTAPNTSTGGATGGPVTSYVYDGDSRTTSVTDPNSHTTSYAYNDDGQVTSVTDALGNITSYAFDHDGRVTSETDPNPSTGGSTGGPVTSYAYNPDSQVTGVTDPRGHTTSYAYDHDGRIITVTQPAASGSGGVTSYGYDAASNITGVTDALGNLTVYAYNADNKMTSVTQPDPDGSGPLSSPVTSYSYDNMGRLLVLTDPLSHTTSYTYTADSQVASVTDGMGNVTSYAYDHDGRETSQTDPVPATGVSAPVTTYGYNADSELTSTTDPLGNVTSNAFDHDGRLTSTTDAMSQTTSFGYDAAGNQTSGTDPLGNTTTTAFNADNQVITITAPVPATGVSAPVTSYTYDHLGRESSVTDPDGHVTSFGFDANGNTTSVTDASSNTTTYTFDNLNRVTGETDANSHTASYSYDAVGDLTSQTDKDGRVTNFSYDNLGRMTQEQWMSSGTAIYTATYAYNAVGALTSATDNYSEYAYTYNADNSVTQVDNNGTPTGPHVVLNIGYDHLQRETSLSATVAGTLDLLNNYSYDAGSELTQITQQSQSGGNSVAPKVVNFTYNADGQYSTISRYANLAATQLVATSTYGYDANGDMTSLSHDKGGTNLNAYTWTYDHDGRVTGDSSVDGTDGYTYDAASQVTAATHSYQTNESYSFDATGNRTNTGYSTGTNNETTSDGTYNYLYDANGNMTKKTTILSGDYVTYTWDYRNRLTDVQNYSSSNVLQSHIHYTYDIFDRLIEKQTDPTGGGTYTSSQSFVYDGDNAILVYDGSGTLTDRLLVTPPLSKGGPGGGGATGDGGNGSTLADENNSGTVSWLLTDNEGTIRDVAQYNSGTNTTTIVDHLEYNSFGVITAQSNSAFQPLFAYTDQMWDAAVSLYFYHARWYDPRTGRFISQDPTGFAAGDANLYRYVQNSPPNFIDPTGTIGSGFSGSGGAGPGAMQQQMDASMNKQMADTVQRAKGASAAARTMLVSGEAGSGGVGYSGNDWLDTYANWYNIDPELRKATDFLTPVAQAGLFFMSDAHLANANAWELFGITTAYSAVAVVGAYYGLPALIAASYAAGTAGVTSVSSTAGLFMMTETGAYVLASAGVVGLTAGHAWYNTGKPTAGLNAAGQMAMMMAMNNPGIVLGPMSNIFAKGWMRVFGNRPTGASVLGPMSNPSPSPSGGGSATFGPGGTVGTPLDATSSPNLQWHHIWPRCLGYPPQWFWNLVGGRGLVLLPSGPGSVHQAITNLFQQLLPWQGRPYTPEQMAAVVGEIYRMIPIDGYPHK